MNQVQTLPTRTLALAEKEIAILGNRGTFHEIAARCYFSDTAIRVRPNSTFEQVVETVQSEGSTDIGIMAIENSLAGSLMYNYNLIEASNLEITGEVYLRIRQNLMTLPGRQISDLEEVHSHPMAIEQCRHFFAQYPHIRLVESSDTASSAQAIREKGLERVGAIASTLAAEMHQLEIIAPGIETNKKNYTRFWVVQPKGHALVSEKADKVSLCFAVEHEVGYLHRILSVFAAYNLNLTKIQSAPIAGRTWEYHFFVDFEVRGKISWKQALEAIEPLVMEIKVLGAYQKGLYHDY